VAAAAQADAVGESKLDAFKPFIDEVLRTDLDAPCKQRHPVKRIYDRLMAERRHARAF
jgi:hypothetical protein